MGALQDPSLRPAALSFAVSQSTDRMAAAAIGNHRDGKLTRFLERRGDG